MSRNHRGLITNTKLFMDNPVPIRDTTIKSRVFTKPNNKATTDDSIYYKGNKNKKGKTQQYQHVGGADDIYIINNSEGSFQLHRSALRESLSELSDYAN